MCNEDRAEQTSLEEIIGSLFLANEVDKSVIAALWTIITPTATTTANVGNSSADGSNTHIDSVSATNTHVNGGGVSLPLLLPGALNVLAMIAKLQPDLVTPAKVRLVIDAALAPSLTLMKQRASTPSTHPLSVIRAACKLLQTTRGSGLHTVLARVRAGKGDGPVGSILDGVNGGVGESQSTLDRDLHQALLETTPMLRDVLLGCFIQDTVSSSDIDSPEGGASTTATRCWFSACEEAMHALFHSHPCPDKVIMTHPLNNIYHIHTNNLLSTHLMIPSTPPLSTSLPIPSSLPPPPSPPSLPLSSSLPPPPTHRF